ncbi:MAG: homoserine dehydrogenase, partial [Clostridia bacterium]|nr:homoserine dehydrogenase [Clostridia bacterium]
MKAAILGYGFVGSGAYEITRDFPTGIEVKRVLTRTPRPELPFVTQDFDDILNDPEIEIVAEAMGGLHPAYEYVTAAMKAGKHVVSANKQLICHYYEELFALAAEMGVQLRFTPSAGGGIPWLCNLMRVKRCDEVSELSGILNGTTNYILHCMTHEGLPFDQVLADAQRKGYAEADPSADIDGIDALRKCAISASLAFDTIVEEDSLQAFGIRHITKADVDNFRALGKVCKLLV